MKRIALIGGTSGIGRALADAFVARGDRLYLTGRSEEEVERVMLDLEVRHQVDVAAATLDALDPARREQVVLRASETLGGLDGVVVTFGEVGDRQRARTDDAYRRLLHDVNYQAPVDLLDSAAAYFEAHPGEGRFVAAIGSVAGDRGRQSNYHYGASKAALHTYLQGLRQRLHGTGTAVVTIKPGLIETPMTFGRDDLVFVVPAERAAADILAAVDRGRPEVYTPWFWRWIMRVIRWLPDTVYRRLEV